MKILLIDVNSYNSSTGDIVKSQKHFLESMGHEVILCYARGNKLNEKNVFKFAFRVETLIHAILTRLTGYTDCYSFFSTVKLINKIKKFKPDIIHAHELHSYFLNSSMFWKFIKKNNYKILWSLHCDIAFTGRCGLAYDCQHYKHNCGKCESLLSYPKTLFFDKSKNMLLKKKMLYSDYKNLFLSTPSKWLMNRLQSSILSDRPCRVIHNGKTIDASFSKNFFKDNYGVQDEVILSVVPSFYDDNKGVKHVIELATKCKDKIFFIISKDYKGDMKILPNLYSISNIEKIDIYSAYASASLFLLTSRFESFSFTVLESLIFGTKVVGFRCGAPETIYDEKYAKFVKYGDLDALAEVIYSNDEESREDIMNYALKFNENEMCENYLEYYEEICKM